MSRNKLQRPVFRARAWLCLVALQAFLLAGCGQSAGNAELTITGRGSDRPDAICRNFSLTAMQAKEFFKKAKPITPAQLHDDYEYMPCWVTGKTTGPQGSIVWEIRPISIGEVTLPDNSRKLLGCKDCDDLFQ